jgi:hypothetical protein
LFAKSKEITLQVEEVKTKGQSLWAGPNFFSLGTGTGDSLCSKLIKPRSVIHGCFSISRKVGAKPVY